MAVTRTSTSAKGAIVDLLKWTARFTTSPKVLNVLIGVFLNETPKGLLTTIRSTKEVEQATGNSPTTARIPLENRLTGMHILVRKLTTALRTASVAVKVPRSPKKEARKQITVSSANMASRTRLSTPSTVSGVNNLLLPRKTQVLVNMNAMRSTTKLIIIESRTQVVVNPSEWTGDIAKLPKTPPVWLLTTMVNVFTAAAILEIETILDTT